MKVTTLEAIASLESLKQYLIFHDHSKVVFHTPRVFAMDSLRNLEEFLYIIAGHEAFIKQKENNDT